MHLTHTAQTHPTGISDAARSERARLRLRVWGLPTEIVGLDFPLSFEDIKGLRDGCDPFI
jgi:hypothetical protein